MLCGVSKNWHYLCGMRTCYLIHIFDNGKSPVLACYCIYTHTTRANLIYRCPSGSSVILCDSLTSAGSPWGPSGYDVSGKDSRCARWCSLACFDQHHPEGHMTVSIWKGTYEWDTAICAPIDLRLVGVDEDPGVSERAASTVAGDDALLGPADGLLVNQLDGRVRARLRFILLANRSLRAVSPSTLFQSSPCSNSTSPAHDLLQTYLIFENRLLKTRPRHSHLSRLLTPTPDPLAIRALPIRRLHDPQFLPLLHALDEHLVKRALGRRWRRIGR